MAQKIPLVFSRVAPHMLTSTSFVVFYSTLSAADKYQLRGAVHDEARQLWAQSNGDTAACLKWLHPPSVLEEPLLDASESLRESANVQVNSVYVGLLFALKELQ